MLLLKYPRLLFIILLSVFASIATLSYGQEGLPIIKSYSVENYQAGVENWDAIQDDRGLMYFANSEGVMEYDGVNWRLIPTTNRSVIRSLAKSEKDVIYVGGDSELGFLATNNSGQRVYRSLLHKCPEEYRKFANHIWKVICFKGYKYFLAGGSVLVFDEQDDFVKFIKEDIYLRSLFLIDSEIYAYSNIRGLLVLDTKNQEFLSFYKDDFILNRSLEFVAGHPEGGIRFHIFDKGFYRLYRGKLSPERRDFSKPVNTDYIFCQNTVNNHILLGTTTNGIYFLSKDSLEVLYHFDKSLGINDNKVFAVYSDHDKNIWICHENGLSYIEFNSPIRLINEKLGINGTGYCSIVYDSTLFVGTSHGLFASLLDEAEDFYDFNLFKLIRQPVFFLEKRGNSLLIGCLHEIFEYDGRKLSVFSKTSYNKKLLALPGVPDHYLVSSFEGFTLIKFDKKFEVVRKIQGLDFEIRDFVFDDSGIWVINGNGKLFLADLTSNLEAFRIQKHFEDSIYKDLRFLALSRFHNNMVLGTSKGLYAYDSEGRKLKRIVTETDGREEFVSNWLYNQNNEDLWFEKSFLENGKLKYKIDILSDKDRHFSKSLNSIIYGNKAFSFNSFSDSELAVGTSGGFLLYNLDFSSGQLSKAETYIRKIVVMDDTDTANISGIWAGADNRHELPLKVEEAQVEFSFASNYFYSQENVIYSYKLEGVDADWKSWSKDNKVRYSINDYGDFTFKVKATSNYSAESNISSYHFVIEKPWYKTLWWYSIEVGFLLLLMAFSIYLNRLGSSRISKISAFILVLIVLTVFEIFSELIQDFLDAQGVTIFALKIAINISIALTINPVERWVRKKLIKNQPEYIEEEKYPEVKGKRKNETVKTLH